MSSGGRDPDYPPPLPEERLDLVDEAGPPPPSATDRRDLIRSWPAVVPWIALLGLLMVAWAVFLR